MLFCGDKNREDQARGSPSCSSFLPKKKEVKSLDIYGIVSSQTESRSDMPWFDSKFDGCASSNKSVTRRNLWYFSLLNYIGYDEYFAQPCHICTFALFWRTEMMKITRNFPNIISVFCPPLSPCLRLPWIDRYSLLICFLSFSFWTAVSFWRQCPVGHWDNSLTTIQPSMCISTCTSVRKSIHLSVRPPYPIRGLREPRRASESLRGTQTALYILRSAS